MEFNGDLEFLENGDEIIGAIDWNFLYDDANPAVTAATESASPSSSSTVEDAPANQSWFEEVENLLMKDDDGGGGDGKVVDAEVENFLADILVESPLTESPIDADSDKDKTDLLNNNVDADDDDDDDDDHLSKKRKRQLRNKDAAMRSRERRKMYVTELEMKSKYLEGECRRLGRLLQCCYAENNALRLGLQMGNAYGCGVSGSKQESAVLFLELLLLGSLLWFLDLTFLFSLPLMPHLLLLNLNQEHGNKAAGGAVSKTFWALQSQSFVKTRRCKASKTKMKPAFFVSILSK